MMSNESPAHGGAAMENGTAAANGARKESGAANGVRKESGSRAEKQAAREALFYLVFESLFSPESPEEIIENAYAADNFDIDERLEERFTELMKAAPEIDALISKHSQKREFSRLPKVSAAILRVAFFEILKTDLHQNIAVSEAVRFATDFADTGDVKFINGVLGEYVRSGD
jgi:N utilization substance protein B